MNLNIIGNGFDLFHGLPSSYYFFGCYLIEKDPEFYIEISKSYGFKSRIFGRHEDDFQFVVEDMFWKDFEKHLGSVDEYFIFDTYEDDLGLENDDPVELEMDEYKVAITLKKYFNQWVNETLDLENNYEIIKNNINTSKLKYEDTDMFITFNYTHILQSIYEIESHNICYIHGECLDDNYDQLVVGHGNDSRIQDIRNNIDELEGIYDHTQSSKNRISEHKSLLRFLEHLKKDVKSCFFECEIFFRCFSNEPDMIKIYGLSLGEVDLPYLKKIKDRWSNTKWQFSYFGDRDFHYIDIVAQDYLNLTSDDYSKFLFRNDSSDEIRERIIQDNNIELYKLYKTK